MSGQLQHQVKSFTTKETAAELRKALRQAWPTVRFSVRMARGTGHGWFDVAWTDGPPTEQVDRICARFKDRYFDGRDDAYHRVEPTLYAAEDGSLYEPRYSCCGVVSQRAYCAEVEAWAATAAGPGSRWWDDQNAPQRFDPAYYATRKLLAGLDLTAGIPIDPAGAYRDRWER